MGKRNKVYCQTASPCAQYNYNQDPWLRLIFLQKKYQGQDMSSVCSTMSMCRHLENLD